MDHVGIKHPRVAFLFVSCAFMKQFLLSQQTGCNILWFITQSLKLFVKIVLQILSMGILLHNLQCFLIQVIIVSIIFTFGLQHTLQEI